MRNRWIIVVAMLLVVTTVVLGQIHLKPPQTPNAPKVPHGQSQAATGTQPPRNTEPFSISGIVKDNKGDALSGVQVNATSRYSATTGSDGRYSIQGLDRSIKNYSVKVNKTGYTFSPSGANVTSPANGNVQNLNFTGTSTAKPKSK